MACETLDIASNGDRSPGLGRKGGVLGCLRRALIGNFFDGRRLDRRRQTLPQGQADRWGSKGLAP